MNALYDVWINEKKQKNESVAKQSYGLNLPSGNKLGRQKSKKSNTVLPKKPTTPAKPRTICVEHDMNIRRNYLKQMQEGSKTVEGRPNFLDLGRINSGDIIRFKVCGWNLNIKSQESSVKLRSKNCACVCLNLWETVRLRVTNNGPDSLNHL